MLVALAALVLALALGLGLVPGARAHAVRVACAAVALVAGLVLAGAAVAVSLASAAETAGAQAGAEQAAGPEAPTSGAEGEAQDGDEAGEAASVATREPLPEGFSYVRDLAPTIEVELRYATTDNFTGQIVDGYESTEAAVLRTEAAEALALVQQDLEQQGLGLRIYDAFRPTRAVSFFMEWSRSGDEATKLEYYPDFNKPELFELGYIAEKSGHSLGGTVDLTLVSRSTGEPLDMGGPFDYFGELSHYETVGLDEAQTANRALLHNAMQARGFKQYPLEWWHFSYPLPEGTMPMNFVVR